MDWEQFMHKFKAATGLTSDQIIDTVQALPISYFDAYDFYIRYARFPNSKESRDIYQLGGFAEYDSYTGSIVTCSDGGTQYRVTHGSIGTFVPQDASPYQPLTDWHRKILADTMGDQKYLRDFLASHLGKEIYYGFKGGCEPGYKFVGNLVFSDGRMHQLYIKDQGHVT